MGIRIFYLGGTMPEFDLPENIHDHVLEQLMSKDWEDLKMLEHAGYLLFPENLYKRTKDGKFEAKPIMLRIPREPELRKARIESRRIAKEDGLDLNMDKDLIETIECTCILSMSIRNNTPPYEPWEPDPRLLEKYWDRSSLSQLWAKLDELAKVIDPRPENISSEEMLMLMTKIAKVRNIHPLHAYGPGAQNFFIVTMAGLSLTYLESKSSSELSELLTQDQSKSKD